EEAEGATGLGGQAGATAGRLRQPAAGEPGLWPAPAPEERRVDRAELCAWLRHRRDEKDASTRTSQHPQAPVDSHRGVQSEPDLPLFAGSRHSPGAEKSAFVVYFCTFLAYQALPLVHQYHYTLFFYSRSYTIL